MKICVIGNSHIAAIKNGWGEVRTEYPRVELTFFGAQSADLRLLKVQDGAVVPTSDRLREMLRYTSGGLESIEPIYDRFLIVGCKLSFQWLVGAVMEEKGKAHVRECLSQTQAMTIAEQLREIANAPIGVMPVPYSALETAAEAYKWNGPEDELAALSALYRTTLESLGRERHFEPILQPNRTIRDTVYTKAKFAQGSERLQKKTASRYYDGVHMNARFGAICLRTLLDA